MGLQGVGVQLTEHLHSARAFPPVGESRCKHETTTARPDVAETLASNGPREREELEEEGESKFSVTQCGLTRAQPRTALDRPDGIGNGLATAKAAPLLSVPKSAFHDRSDALLLAC